MALLANLSRSTGCGRWGGGGAGGKVGREERGRLRQQPWFIELADFQGNGVQSLNHVHLFMTLWTAAHQASLSFTISKSLLILMSIESVILTLWPIPSSILTLSGQSHFQEAGTTVFLLFDLTSKINELKKKKNVHSVDASGRAVTE